MKVARTDWKTSRESGFIVCLYRIYSYICIRTIADLFFWYYIGCDYILLYLNGLLRIWEIKIDMV